MFSRLAIIVALLDLSAAVPLQASSSSSSTQSVPQYHELHTRSLLSQLDKREQPRLAQNAAQEGDLPVVTLPYGQYRASKYVKDVDIYVFKNVRFGAPPTGALRFAPPQPPVTNMTMSDGSYGPQCIQSLSISNIVNLDLAGILSFGDMPTVLSPLPITPLLDQLKPIVLNLGQEGALDKIIGVLRPLLAPGGPLAAFPGTIGDLIETLSGVLGAAQAEDCLFLDVYVPGKVIRKEITKPLPVMHWIYGGAYIFGTKDGLYDGYGMLEASKNEMIFVANNYRLGAFGFLAGRTAEQANATNLGLYDQRAALQWTQDYIGLFGGDKDRVTAAGESAGAGSLMHQITAFGGQQQPLFRQAILQSPAFQPMFDRDGLAESVFKSFEAEAGCAGQGFQCLSTVSVDQFQKANEKIIKAAPPGTFSFGPAADGRWSRQVPSVELYSGNYYKGLDGLLLSHTGNEPSMFTDPEIDTPMEFDQFERKLLPDDAAVQQTLQSHFNQLPDAKSRLVDLVQGSSFGCNVRYLTQAYPGKTYNMQYSKARGTHGSDILPTFYSKQNPLTALVGIINPAIPLLARNMQGYFTSYVLTGDPNQVKSDVGTPLPPMPMPSTIIPGLPPLQMPPGLPPMPSVLPPLPGLPPMPGAPQLPGLNAPRLDMPKITNAMAETYGPILSIDDMSSLINDQTTTAKQCDFWKDIEIGSTKFLGYTAPGTVVAGDIVPSSGDPSRNYNTPRQARA